MGSLLYGKPGSEISFGERALIHLWVVITAKLRRRESFLCTWTDYPDLASGRSSIWLDPGNVIRPRPPGCGTRPESRSAQAKLSRRPHAPAF